ncbi:hypothetical protein DFH29DRAFT_962611 [Suillus ampliporus]|nr:hypothetical protein DFH29DRAFT_962611 [Suillus ampliporus]
MMLKLNCWAVGDDPNCVFPVKIESTETVGDLKEVIQDKMKHEYNPFDAKSLNLWKVDIDLKKDSDLLEMIVAEGGVQCGYKLAGWTPLHELFTDAPEDSHLHIIVQRPLKGSHGPLLSSSASKKLLFVKLPQPRKLTAKVATTSMRAGTDKQPQKVVTTTSTRISANNQPRNVATTSTHASADNEPVAEEEKGEVEHVHPCARCAVTNNKCVGKKEFSCKICTKVKRACSMATKNKTAAEWYYWSFALAGADLP